MAPVQPTGDDGYDAFVSYKRADIAFARLLEKALNAYKPPPTLAVPQRRLRVFRDEGDLTGSEYFKSIDKVLARSGKLIVICSPAARQSSYVDDEIRRFVAHRGADHVIPVLLAGLPNNEARPDQAAEMAFPQALCDALPMPLAVNYRSFEPSRQKVDRGVFEGSWYTLLANLYDKNRDEVEQRERLRRRRARNIVIALSGSVTLGFAVLAAVAYWQKLEADDQRNTALRGLAKYLATMSADVRAGAPQTSLLLAVEAVRATRDADGGVTTAAQDALRQSLSGAAGEPPGADGMGVTASRFSADGHRLATLHHSGRIDVWNLDAPGQAPWSMPAAADTRSLGAFGADGRWLALAEGQAGNIVVWNVDAPAASATRLGERAGQGARVHGFSPDGRWLATSDAEARLYLWRLDDLAAGPRVLAGHRPRRGSGGKALGISEAVFDPGSNWVCTTGWDGTVRLWSLKEAETASQQLENGNWAGPVHFSGDGQWIAQMRSGDPGLWHLEQGTWRFVPMADPAAQGTSSGLDDRVLGFVAQPPGVVTTHGDEARVWRLAPGEPGYRAVPGYAAVLAGGGDAALVTATLEQRPGAAGGPVHAVYLTELGRADAQPARIASFNARVVHLRLAPRRRHLAAVLENGQLWVAALEGAASGLRLLRGQDGPGAGEPHFSADGRWLLAPRRYDGSGVRRWRLDNASSDPVELAAPASKELEYRSSHGGGGGEPLGGLPDAIALDPRSRWVVAPGGNNEALLIDLHDPAAPPRRLGGHTHHVTAAAFSPQGDWLATGDWNHTLRIWRFPGLEQPAQVLSRPAASSESSVSAIAVSPDGTRIATGGSSGEVALWAPAAAAKGPRMLGGHEGWITSLAFSADGRQLLSADDVGKVQLWRLDAPADTEPVVLDAHHGAIVKARFLKGERGIVTAARDSLVRLWSLDAPAKPRATLRGHAGSISGFDLDPQQRWLATGSEDGTVRLWDLQAPATKPILLGPSMASVSAVAVSPDGQLVAAGNPRGEIRVWRRAAPEEPPLLVATAQERPDGGDRESHEVWGLRFTPDGRWLMAMGSGALRLWRMRLDEQMALACRIAGRNLGAAEWQAYLAQVPYRLTCQEQGLHPNWLHGADELARSGDTAGAAAQYEIARQLSPGLDIDPKARALALAVDSKLREARGLARGGETDAALAVFNTVQALDPARGLDPAVELERSVKARKLEQEANDRANRGDVDGAVVLFRQARAMDASLEVDPLYEAQRLAAPAIERHGNELARQGDLEAAVAEYRRALDFGLYRSFDPLKEARNVRAHQFMDMAKEAGTRGDLDGATQLFRQALALDPALDIDPVAEARKSVVEYRLEKAAELWAKGRIVEAGAMFRQEFQVDPGAVAKLKWSFNGYCWDAVKHSQATPQALDFCDRAVAQQPDSAAERDSRGMARLLAGNIPGAIEDLAVYVERAPQEYRSQDDVEARKRLIAQLRRGARFKTFQQLQALGVKP
ncbi:TIR domain-containing protein [Azohydromonas caseinilytica]|uniref:TIR domain-containing protein n=1 Tax=Azohydromonas caseinilytica TaxID=2728836 RepID=A0A848FJ63_9BURK|nr:TIR domain-containing protein [Azohydromonas caseinilytica]NML18935.1 TIR domain-containing protein [Azohydromonas caseinilytica]